MPSLHDSAHNRYMREMFTRIAGMYDRLNHVLTLGVDVLWRKRALARLAGMGCLDVSNGGSILDLATGTADFAILAAKKFASARVTGVDLTPAMLEVGRQKVERAGLSSRIVLKEGDASSLPCADASFDVVICAFGFRNFLNRDVALAEVRRVLKPGGRLLVLELFRPQSRLLGGLTSAWLRRVAPFFAGKARQDYAYLRSSIGNTCSSAEFIENARSKGLSDEFLTFFLPVCSCLLFQKCDTITI